MTSLSARASRTLMALVVISVALVIAALIAVAMRPTPRSVDPDLPEGTVQHFVVALQGQELEQAAKYYDASTLQLCDPALSNQSSLQIKLKSSRIREDHAVVEVNIAEGVEQFSSFPGSAYNDVFELARVDDRWQVTSAPWPFALCTAKEMGY